mmetsp:Transcript_14772/g.28976  ORF Transcript_14772/g.28976 Transcript_14772/m.28976 type:complete len:240 (-) Transcript_14772:2797-3516(-)
MLGTGTKPGEALTAYLKLFQDGMPEPPRLVHRLDKDVSGVLLLARHRRSAEAVCRLFEQNSASGSGVASRRTVRKLYLGVVVGLVPLAQGRIEIALPSNKRNRHHCELNTHATTLYTRLAYSLDDNSRGNLTALLLQPLTGRKRQLRAHCAALGHPLLGDSKFLGPCAEDKKHPGSQRPGKRPEKLPLHLHAFELSFLDPLSEQHVVVRSPVPSYMQSTFSSMGLPEKELNKLCLADPV